MRIPVQILSRVASGAVTLQFRRWTKPTVKAGGRLRTPIGELAIESVTVVTAQAITAADALAAGASSRKQLLEFLNSKPLGRIHRVRFHLAGPDTRIALREQAELSPSELAAVLARLARLDAASSHGSWTQAVLETIHSHPATRAPDLAAQFGRETQPFKTDVRKLKSMGLTESLAVGYLLSPRGQRVLRALQP